MKILLVQPKMHKRPMDTDLKTRMSPSLALLTLQNLTPPGHEVIICNENCEKLNENIDPDFVGITVTLDVMPRACKIARRFRSRGIPVAAGGIHITCSPEDCAPHFDAICVGPAERVWARMTEDAQTGRLRKIYQDTDGFRGEEIASPRYSVNPKHMFNNVVLTSRGCPNRCAFCYNSCENRCYVTRPIPDVLRDITALGTRHVLFIDDNFIGTPDYTRELLLAMKDMRLIWQAAVTADILSMPDLLDLMAQTGCKSLFIGLESINDASLQSVNKHNQATRYEQLVEAIHSRGIMVNASMVFGLDGDGPDVFRRSLDWLVRMRVETLTSHILTPYPGTQLHRRMEQAGEITDYDLSHYNTAHVVFRPRGMTAEELYAGYRRIYRQFYSLRNIARRMPKAKGQRVPYLLFNLFYRKYGRLTSAVAQVIPMRVMGRLGAWMSYRVPRTAAESSMDHDVFGSGMAEL